MIIERIAAGYFVPITPIASLLHSNQYGFFANLSALIRSSQYLTRSAFFKLPFSMSLLVFLIAIAALKMLMQTNSQRFYYLVSHKMPEVFSLILSLTAAFCSEFFNVFQKSF